MPEPMDHHEKMRLRAAAARVKQLHPGALGEIVARELSTWEEFGYRFGGHRLVAQAVDDILKAPMPTQPTAVRSAA